MLEIQRIRTEKESVITGLKKRNFDATEIVESLLTVEQQWRNSKTELEGISAELNILAKEIGNLMKQGKQDEANAAKSKTSELKEKEAALKTTVDELDAQIIQFLYQLPNVPNEIVPAGKSEEDNVNVLEVGNARTFDFTPLPHWEICKKYDIIDFELGVKSQDFQEITISAKQGENVNSSKMGQIETGLTG